MSKLNFRIVESSSNTKEIDYESFKQDFLDPYTPQRKIMEKYGLNQSDWKEYRGRVLGETGLLRKPSNTHPENTLLSCNQFIRKIGNDRYLIVKRTNYKTRYYGRYDDYDIAKMVRDKLVESGWDQQTAEYYIDKYGCNRRKPIYARSHELYPIFKELYFNSPLTIKEIRKKHHITQRMYEYLLMMIREEYGVFHRKRSVNP